MGTSFQNVAMTLALAVLSGAGRAQETGDAAAVMDRISWFGHSSVRIESGGRIVYVDPISFRKGEKADLILVTHLHEDHYSRACVQALTKPGTVVVAPRDLGTGNRILKPGEKAMLAGFPVEAVPAYNIVRKQFHPRSDANNGYIVTVEGVRVYHSGDTERIPEMQGFRCGIAMVPLGQKYTFGSVGEAVAAVLDTGAHFAMPIHWGMNEGTAADARLFRDELGKKGVTVVLPDRQ